MTWRTPAAIGALVLLAWVGIEIGRAGSDVPPPPRAAGPSTLTGGVVSGRRIDGRAWTLDADKVQMSADQTQATIEHVANGRLHRPGKPDVLLSADNVTINTLTNDLTIRGPVKITEPLAGGSTRTFQTTGATYLGVTHTLQLDHPATISEGGATITVAKATVDFATGRAKLGRIEGSRPGSAP